MQEIYSKAASIFSEPVLYNMKGLFFYICCWSKGKCGADKYVRCLWRLECAEWLFLPGRNRKTKIMATATSANPDPIATNIPKIGVTVTSFLEKNYIFQFVKKF